MKPRPYLLTEANYRQLLDYQPNVAILPWGATEAHNYHLPYVTDVIEATRIAEEAAAVAFEQKARPIVLPAIPFGNDAQQLDQIATIHLSTTTAVALLRDVATSLMKQGIDRLILLNGHGGNDFKPLVRDIQAETGLFIVVVNFFQLVPEVVDETYDDPGDHAGELETSLLLHLTPELVRMEQAGEGAHVPFRTLTPPRPGVWTPRPWARTHPDTGSGNPINASADKGKRHFEAMVEVLAGLILDLSKADRDQLP